MSSSLPRLRVKRELRVGPFLFHRRHQYDLGYTPLLCVHRSSDRGNCSTRIWCVPMPRLFMKAGDLVRRSFRTIGWGCLRVWEVCRGK